MLEDVKTTLVDCCNETESKANNLDVEDAR